MTEYDGVVLVDADAVLVGNIDEPFEFLRMSDYPMAAVQDISAPPGDHYERLEFKGNLNAGG